MSDQSVLTQARTPTKAEADAARAAITFEDAYWEMAASKALLRVAAPRILTLAYREAAARLRLLEIYGPSRHAIAGWLEALATALEEGTPE